MRKKEVCERESGEPASTGSEREGTQQEWLEREKKKTSNHHRGPQKGRASPACVVSKCEREERQVLLQESVPEHLLQGNTHQPREAPSGETLTSHGRLQAPGTWNGIFINMQISLQALS